MKKWIGAICSALAGILSLVFLSLPVLTMKIDVLGFKESETVSGWKLLTDGEAGYTAVKWYRVFAWILVVLAVILIIMAVLQILSNVGLIKMPAILTTVNKVALLTLVVVSILALVANFGIRAEMIDDFGGKEVLKASGTTLSVGASLWVVSIVNVIAAVCGNLFKAKD